MNTSVDEDLARVTVISPTRRVDLALPGSVTLGELLPSIVRFSGYEGGSPTEAVYTWVLQRFGEDPLDPNTLINKLDIRDGETLHLRQRDNAIPDAAFDDVVDAVNQTTDRRPSWQSKHSQNMALGMLVGLLVGVPLLADIIISRYAAIGHRSIAWGVINLAFAFFAAIASVTLSRAAGRYKVAAVLAWSSVVLAGLGGLQLLADPQLSTRVVVASALVMLAAGSCALAARVTTMGLFAAAIVGALVLTASAAQTINGGKGVHAAAVVACVLLAIIGYMPSLSYRLARIALPSLPSNAEAILTDDQPVQSDIVSRAVLADRLLAAILSAVSISIGIMSAVMVTQLPRSIPGARSPWWQLALALCIGLSLLMRARSFVGLSQRLALLLSGSSTVLLATIFSIMQLPTGVVQISVAVVVIVASATVLSYYASSTYAKIMTPIWGRIGDIIEWLSAMAIVPLLLGVLNLYSAMRGLFG